MTTSVQPYTLSIADLKKVFSTPVRVRDDFNIYDTHPDYMVFVSNGREYKRAYMLVVFTVENDAYLMLESKTQPDEGYSTLRQTSFDNCIVFQARSADSFC